MMGGEMAHEYMYLAPIGEDTLVLCNACGYAANRQVAQVHKPASAAEQPRPVEKVATPGATTIDALATYLQIYESDRQGGIFVAAIADTSDGDTVQQRFVFAVVRGDGAQRNQAGQCSQSTRVAPGARGRNPRHWGRARLCLAH